MNGQSTPRWINIVVGLWLMLSAFSWSHGSAQSTNVWVVGTACTVTAALALRLPVLRFVNAALGIWLFVSTWVFPESSAGTLWNSVLSSLVMLVVALVPSPRERATGYRH